MDPPTATDEHRRPGGRILRQTVERSTGTAFVLAGTTMLASFVVPIGLSAVTDLAWLAGLALVGLAVVGVAVGVHGMYLRLDVPSPAARIGTAAASIAGVVAAGWLVAIAVVVAGAGLAGTAVPRPMGLFRWTALAMASGFALGYVLVGAAHARGAGPHRRAGQLMAVGGVALLLPVVVALVGPAFAVRTPGWLLFPVLGFVALDTLVVGRLGRTSRSPN